MQTSIGGGGKFGLEAALRSRGNLVSIFLVDFTEIILTVKTIFVF